MDVLIGIDVGSVATKVALIDHDESLIGKAISRTRADPIRAIRESLLEILNDDFDVVGVGVTGSGKELAGLLVGADLVLNEISAHATAAIAHNPGAKTVIEIGGQDAKLILLRDDLIRDFAMNSVCAAGTGSFLEQQANRLNITLEELGDLAEHAEGEVAIAARCTVFAESDMIYKQQLGYPRPDILYGLCVSLARNYLNTLGRGKAIEDPIVFQGGVASNRGMLRAFRQVLAQELVVPEESTLAGAYGVALAAKRRIDPDHESAFSLQALSQELTAQPFICDECEQRCNVIMYQRAEKVLGYRGDLCGRYSLGSS